MDKSPKGRLGRLTSISLRKSAMKTYSLGRGRKKAVKKFTRRQGLWMSLMIGAAMVGMLLLFLFGVFHVD
jgi:hypothetical protein